MPKSRAGILPALVGVCDVCGEVVSIPHQSAPRLKEAREVPAEKVEYRLPRELADVLHLIAAEFGVRTDDFTSPLLKFYMREFTRDASFRRRVGRLSRARLAPPVQRHHARPSMRMRPLLKLPSGRCGRSIFTAAPTLYAA